MVQLLNSKRSNKQISKYCSLTSLQNQLLYSIKLKSYYQINQIYKAILFRSILDSKKYRLFYFKPLYLLIKRNKDTSRCQISNQNTPHDYINWSWFLFIIRVTRQILILGIYKLDYEFESLYEL
ncbi:unnamed protein product [Paramecium sonneborni]|uniref:Uncharacterized protein n=1 Tax=Paramecium sonneborni TaxID=65129 RepID=A0A8S1MYC7_9CILI|nr:unnamed protein product [Paramecium sonneborni]